jgi:hypothetical protein
MPAPKVSVVKRWKLSADGQSNPVDQAQNPQDTYTPPPSMADIGAKMKQAEANAVAQYPSEVKKRMAAYGDAMPSQDPNAPMPQSKGVMVTGAGTSSEADLAAKGAKRIGPYKYPMAKKKK